MSPAAPVEQTRPADIRAFDQVIEALRARLEARIPWLERSYGRAYQQLEVREGNKRLIPKLYSGDTEYFSALPNDRLRAFSFFVGRDPATPLEGPQPFAKSFFYNKSADLIIYFNYQAIDPSRDYPFAEELIEQVIAVIDQYPAAWILSYFTEEIRAIYSGFDLRDTEERFLYYPYGALRLNLNFRYTLRCVEACDFKVFPYTFPFQLCPQNQFPYVFPLPLN